MVTITTVLRTDKTNKKGLAPVHIRIIKNRKIRYISTGIKLEKKDWDKKEKRVKKSHDNSRTFNAFLLKKFSKVHDDVFEAEKDYMGLTSSDLKDHVYGKTSPIFLDYAFNFIEREYKSKGKGPTYDRYKSTLNKLRDYIDDSEFRISDFTVGFIKDYELHLRKKYDNHTNTIGKELKSFRRIINEAIIDQVFPFEKNPFHRYKIKWEKTTKSFLIESEIKAIENFELAPGSPKELHRDMFIFACYAGGMRVSDVYLLKWISYTGTHIIYKCRKTGERISIKLTKVAKAIIEKQRRPNQKLSDLIFQVLTLDELESKRLHKIINSRNSSANKTLRYIAKAIGLDKRVSFHTSRHSFATRALSKGMKIHHVSKLLGHASVKTTEVYAKIVNKDLDDAMDVFDE